MLTVGNKIYRAIYVNTSEYNIAIKIEELTITDVDNKSAQSILKFNSTNLCSATSVAFEDVVNQKLFGIEGNDNLPVNCFCYGLNKSDVKILRQKMTEYLQEQTQKFHRQFSYALNAPYMSDNKNAKPPKLIIAFTYYTDGDYSFDFEDFKRKINSESFVRVIRQEDDDNFGELILSLNNPNIEPNRANVYYDARSVLDDLFTSLRFSPIHYRSLIEYFMELVSDAQRHVKDQEKTAIRAPFESFYGSIGGNYDGTHIEIYSIMEE